MTSVQKILKKCCSDAFYLLLELHWGFVKQNVEVQNVGIQGNPSE